jgi:hypothetical protein
VVDAGKWRRGSLCTHLRLGKQVRSECPWAAMARRTMAGKREGRIHKACVRVWVVGVVVLTVVAPGRQRVPMALRLLGTGGGMELVLLLKARGG